MINYEFKHYSKEGIDEVIDLKTSSSFKFLRKGAELFSYNIRDDKSKKYIPVLFRDGDASIPEDGWKNHATVLFPIIGRLKNKKSNYHNNKIVFNSNHGFARDSVFKLDCVSLKKRRAFLIYSLRSDENTKKSYPFDFLFQVIYKIENNDLTITFKVENTSDKNPLYFSCGWHPGFAVDDEYEIDIPVKKMERFIVGESGLLTGEKEIITKKGFKKLIRSDLSKALIFKIKNSKKREISFVNKNKYLKIKFYDFEFLGLWSNKRDDFICIEPWQGVDDFEDQTPFHQKCGIVKLDPGKKKKFKIMINPSIKD